MTARWEIVRTTAGHHARFVAANGKVIMSSEVYTRKRGAENAIEVISQRFIYRVQGHAFITRERGVAEVRYVDLRLRPVERPPLPETS